MKQTFYDKITWLSENALVENLRKYIRIASVYDEKTSSEEHPFGIKVTDALNFICELAKKDGFKA